MINPTISLFPGAKSKTASPITITQVVERIRTDQSLKDRIDSLRAMENEAYSKEKIYLPAVTFSGAFVGGHAKKNLAEYSQLISLDFDHIALDILPAVFAQICELPYILLAFISPSGNGIKAVVRCDYATPYTHEFCWSDIAVNVSTKLTLDNGREVIACDIACKDYSRICFLSYDPAAYYNPECDSYGEIEATPAPAPPTKRIFKKIESDSPPIHTLSLLEQTRILTDRIYHYVEGSYNEYIFHFAQNANKKGVSESECISYCELNFSDYVATDHNGMLTTIKGVYTRLSAEHGTDTFIKKSFSKALGGKSENKTYQNSEGSEPAEVDEKLIFWAKVKKKIRGEDTEEEKIIFFQNGLRRFLDHCNIKRVKLQDSAYEFVQVTDGFLVKKISDFEVRQLIHDHVDKYADGKVKEAYANSQTFTSPLKLEIATEIVKIKAMRDTKDKCTLFYQNTAVEITNSGITLLPYTEINGMIWESKLIKRDFIDHATTIDKVYECDFARFIRYAMSGHKNKLSDADDSMILGCTTAIGYLCHNFKDPSVNRAINAVDKKKRSNSSEANGGAGKSLLGLAISKIIPVCKQSGMEVNFDKEFSMYADFEIGDQMVFIDDVKKNFAFNRLFPVLTGDFSYVKKHKDPVIIPFEESPKFYITTNATLSGSGGAYFRRLHVIEFSSYYYEEEKGGKKHQPIDDFDRMLFYEWDAMEWSYFDYFMADCISDYLDVGLVQAELTNYSSNKFIDRYQEEALDFLTYQMLQHSNDGLIEEIQFDQGDMFAAFVKDNAHLKYTPKFFTQAIKAFCEMEGLEYNRHKNGERWYSGGKTKVQINGCNKYLNSGLSHEDSENE